MPKKGKDKGIKKKQKANSDGQERFGKQDDSPQEKPDHEECSIQTTVSDTPTEQSEDYVYEKEKEEDHEDGVSDTGTKKKKGLKKSWNKIKPGSRKSSKSSLKSPVSPSPHTVSTLSQQDVAQRRNTGSFSSYEDVPSPHGSGGGNSVRLKEINTGQSSKETEQRPLAMNLALPTLEPAATNRLTSPSGSESQSSATTPLTPINSRPLQDSQTSTPRVSPLTDHQLSSSDTNTASKQVTSPEDVVFTIGKESSTTTIDKDQIEKLQKENAELVRRQSESEQTIQRMRQETTDQIQRIRVEAEEVRHNEIERIMTEAAAKQEKKYKQRLAELEESNKKSLAELEEVNKKEVKDAIASTTKRVSHISGKRLREQDEEIAKLKREIEKNKKTLEAKNSELEQQNTQKSTSLNLHEVQTRKELDGKVKELEDKIYAKDAESVYLHGTIQRLESRIRELQLKNRHLDEQYCQLEIVADFKRQHQKPEAGGIESSVDPSENIPSNVHIVYDQLSQLIGHEVVAQDATPHPLSPREVQGVSQAIGVQQRAKPPAYVFAVFTATNSTQSVLLDYSGDFQVPQEESAQNEEDEEYFSLDETEEQEHTNLTDIEKVTRLEKLLKESQEESERFREESEKLRMELKRVCQVAQLQSLPAKDPQQGESFEKLKKNFLKIHAEKLELVEKLAARDEELQQLRESGASRGTHPYVLPSQSLASPLSPEDPKTEIVRLREELINKDKKIGNLEVQLGTFQDVASEKEKLHDHSKDQSRKVVELRRENEAMQKTIQALRDESEAAKAIKTLQIQLNEAEKQRSSLEHEKRHVEDELDIWKQETDAEKKNVKRLQSKITSLQTALHQKKPPDDHYQQELHERDVRIQQLQTDLNLSLAELEVLRAEVTTKKAELVESGKEVHEKEVRIQQLQTDLHLSQAELEALRAEVTIKKAELIESGKANLRLDQRLQTVTEEKAKVDEACATLVATKRSLLDQLKGYDQMQQLMDTFKKQASEFKTKVTEDNKKFTNRIEELEDEIEVRKSEFMETEQKLKKNVEELQMTLETLQAEKKNLAEKITNLEESKSQLEQVVFSQQAAIDNSHKALEDSQVKVQSEIAVIKERLSNQINQLEKEKTDIVLELKAYKLTKDGKKISDLKAEKNAAIAESKYYKEDFERERRDRANLQATLQEKDEKFKQEYDQILQQCEKSFQQFRAANEQLQQQVQWWNEVSSQYPTKGPPKDELSSHQIKMSFQLISEIGRGSFGTAHTTVINGTPAIVKTLHHTFVNKFSVSPEQRQAIQKKFREECVNLSRSKHPNIVRFMGVKYDRDGQNLALVMEQLSKDLDKLIEYSLTCNFILPTSFQVSILADVCSGLSYLHSQSLIHRDLKAENILLTCDLRAKIADLGVSKLLTGKKWLQAQTQAPGSLHCMPPEALSKNPIYDSKLDVFSFGVLALHIAVQEFPDFSWETAPEEIVKKGEGEIFKRQEWIDKVEDHTFSKLIHQCLLEKSRRPKTEVVNAWMTELKQTHPCTVEETLQMFAHYNDLLNSVRLQE